MLNCRRASREHILRSYIGELWRRELNTKSFVTTEPCSPAALPTQMKLTTTTYKYGIKQPLLCSICSFSTLPSTEFEYKHDFAASFIRLAYFYKLH